MATSLTGHVTHLPAILLVLGVCWGVTLGQDVNSTMPTSSNTSMSASPVMEGSQNASVTVPPDGAAGLAGGVPTRAPPSVDTPSTQATTKADSAIETKATEPTTTSTTPVPTTPSTTAQTTPTTTSPSTSVVTSTLSSTLPSTTPTTVTTTVSSTTMESTSTVSPTTMSSTTPSTTPSTTISSTIPSTTMSSTTPSATMSSTTPVPVPDTTTVSSTTAMPSTTPPSTLDPTAAPAVRSTATTSQAINATKAPISIPAGFPGPDGMSTVPTVSQTEFKTASMKPMVTETTAPPPRLASSTASPVATGAPVRTQGTTQVATAVTVSADNATAVVARTTGPMIRQTSGPAVTARGSVPPGILTTGMMRTTKRPDVPAQSTSAYRLPGTDGSRAPTDRMTPRVTQIMGQTTAAVLPVRTSQLRTTSMPVSTSAYDHSRDQTGSDMTSPRGRVTTPVPVVTTAPRIVSTTKITPRMTTSRPIPPVVSTTMPPEMPKDVTYSIRFEGDCRIILSDTSVREKFEQNFVEVFSTKLGVPKDNILLRDISCGSVDVMVTLMGIQQSKVEKSLDEVVSQPIPLVVNADGQTHAFTPISYSLADPSQLPGPGLSGPGGPILEDITEAPAPDPTIVSTPPSGLRSVDMIIIIVVSIIGGLLIVIIIALIIHECRRRSHTKSFDLRGTPRPHIHTEDFTLTKMERGPAEYNDYGLVVNSTANGHTRTPQVGVATIVETPNHHNGDAIHNGYHKAGKEEYEPEYDAGPDSPSISLMKSMRTPDIEGGIENPSFSSEDILDSGTETDKEMVSSDKGLDSPDHAPLQVYPAAESDSGRQSDSLTELPTDTPPQHSPRSNLSDNTGSDHTYEAYEASPTPEIPQSPTHHEVLMPIEEVGYPNEETEASSPPHSPGTPDVLSHSPEHGSYEMVETRSPGKRESDFFAPAEGATAF